MQGSAHWQMGFVGRDAELKFLQRKWQEARQGEPQVVVLLGETGLGKTRLVQEFYHWLARSYEDNGYWPDHIGNSSNSLALNPSIASIGAEHEIPWLWWGVRWPRPDIRNRVEGSACAFVDELPQLQPHFTALLRKEAAIRAAISSATSLASSLANLYTLGTLKVVTDVGLGLKEVYELWQERKKYAELASVIAIEAHQKLKNDAVDRVVEFLTTLLEQKTPVVLVLDDAQWMDPLSIELVRRLLQAAARESWPLFVLVTHWEREWNQARLTAGNSNEAPAILAHYLLRDPALLEKFVSLRLLDKLPDAELGQLLDAALPGLSSLQRQQMLGKVDGNPEYLRDTLLYFGNEPAYFVNRDVAGALNPDGELQLTRALQSDHQGLMQRRFEQIEPRVRELLSYGSRAGARFVDQLVIEAAARMASNKDSPELSTILGKARAPYAWTAEAAQGVSEFRQRRYYELAVEHLERFPSMRADFEQSLQAILDDWYESGRHSSLDVVDRHLFLELLAAQSSTADLAAKELRRRACIDLLGGDRLSTRAAGELALRVLDAMRPSLESISQDRGNWNVVGIALKGIGRSAEAASIYDALIAGHGDLVVVLSARINRGGLLFDRDDIPAAILDWTWVIEHLEAIAQQAGLDIGDLLPMARTNRAIAHKMLGNAQEAINDSTAAIHELQSLVSRVPESHRAAMNASLAAAISGRGQILAELGPGGYEHAKKDLAAAIESLETQARVTASTALPDYSQLPEESLIALAHAHMTMGTIRRRQDDRQALEDLDASIQRIELGRPTARSPKLQLLLATAYLNLGTATEHFGESRKAADAFSHAIASMEGLRTASGEDPGRLFYQSLAAAYSNRGISRMSLDDSAAALSDWRASIAVSEKLRQFSGWSAIDSVRLARLHQSCAELSGPDTHQRLLHLTAAIELLEALTATGQPDSLRNKVLPQLIPLYRLRSEVRDELRLTEGADEDRQRQRQILKTLDDVEAAAAKLYNRVSDN